MSWRPQDGAAGGPDIWAVAGGKGGVGKSVIAANLAVSIARRGLRCLLIDADLGGGNQHTLFGIEAPRTTLDAFLHGDEKELASVAVPTRFHGLSLVYAACDAVGSANPKHSQKQKFIRHIRKADADVVILDLGAGTSFNTLDLFLIARVQLVVTTPELTAIQNAYGFIKCASMRQKSLETEVGCMPRLVANNCDEDGAARVFRALRSVTGAFLASEPIEAGFVRKDPGMPTSVERGLPVVALSPSSVAARDLDRLAQAQLEERFAPPLDPQQDHTMARGLNEELRVLERLYHIQTEDLGSEKRQIRTQVFESGRVVFSKVLPYGTKLTDGRVLPRQQQVEYQHRVVAKAIREQRLT
ncbi:MAG: putative FleN-like cytoskeletal ATPase [Myxococcaceae bacterium]|nr:putative FleN-like cytoskeletal ATPase [Myxococcaceae bacterium]